MAGWLLGLLAAVLIEYFWGYDYISYYLGLPKIPVLFGAILMLKDPVMIPGALAYDLVVYVLPICIVGKATAFFYQPAGKCHGKAAFMDLRADSFVLFLRHFVPLGRD